MQKLISIIRTIALAAIIVGVLHITGLTDGINWFTQSAALKTGLLDVTEDDLPKDKDFNFDFTIKDFEGNKTPFSTFKGKVILLNVWASWCGPCRVEMPGIQKLYDKISNPDIVFAMLSIDKADKKEKVVSYIKNSNFTFPVYMPSGKLTEQLAVPLIPTTFLISKEGKIILKQVGTTNYDTNKFRKRLEEEAAK